MPFSLAPLPYASDALEPLISKETLAFHHGKHHAAYVAKLNELTAGTPLESKSIEDIVRARAEVAPGVFNSAAQTWNHDFYWKSLAPPKDGSYGLPTGAVTARIDDSFGSFDAFKKEFSAAAAGHFGSGWAWLVLDRASGKLRVVQTHDAGSALEDPNLHPILTCDVWEHAYYIDYRNARAAYIDAWWKLANWDFAEEQLLSAAKV
ncbi:iron-containing superoxide dismutase [Hyaloraphidium curvatum]|nr:iron-containing superoxide dismutase [Hyaloraphidium curvatum]